MNDLKISFVMAVYDDAKRAIFTAQAIHMGQPGVGEVLMVDNNPGSVQGQELRDFARSSGGLTRYVAMETPKGTSPPRNRAVREARFPYVVCVDSHVVPGRGFVESMAQFYHDHGWGCPDLLHGPILNEAKRIHSHLLNDQWRAQAWGTWGVAWVSPAGQHFSVQHPKGRTDTIEFVTLDMPQRVLSLAELGLPPDFPIGHAGYERLLYVAGFGHAEKPFQIPGHGLGMFATRRDDWLGFPEEARGFGSEEMCIHAKYRQAGRAVWCVPGMKWWHHFHRDGKPPYRLTTWDKLRNYVVWFRELGRDPAEIRRHFVDELRFPASEYEQAAAGAVWPKPLGGVRPGTMSQPPADLLPDIRAAEARAAAPATPAAPFRSPPVGPGPERSPPVAGDPWTVDAGFLVGPVDPGLLAAPVAPPSPAPTVPATPVKPPPTPMPPAEMAVRPGQSVRKPTAARTPPVVDGEVVRETCGGCGDGKSGDEVAELSLADRFKKYVEAKGDINEHLETMRALVAKAPRVVEMGVRGGVSTTAFLSGGPAELTSYDITPSTVAKRLAKFVPAGTKFEFVVGDSTQVDIPECDLLFLDTDPHTADRVYAELDRHHAKVSSYILLHDTEIFGEKVGDKPGILPAVRTFVRKHPEWFTSQHWPNNNGLTLLSRLDADRPKDLPPLWRRAITFLSATVKQWMAGGFLTKEAADARHKVCRSNGGRCPLKMRDAAADQCTKCGCYLTKRPNGKPGKTFYPFESCPFGLWGPVEKPEAKADDVVDLTRAE